MIARDADRLAQTASCIDAQTRWRTAYVADASQVKIAVDDIAAELQVFDVVVVAAGFGIYFTTDIAYGEAIAA